MKKSVCRGTDVNQFACKKDSVLQLDRTSSHIKGILRKSKTGLDYFDSRPKILEGSEHEAASLL